MRSYTKSRSAILVAVCAAALSVAACGKSDKPANPNAAAGTEGAATVSSSPEAQQKFSAYAEGFNILIDTFGVSYQYDLYQKINVPSASPTATFNFPSQHNVIERALVKLKEGRALKGDSSTAAADAAADKLIASAESLLAKLKELGPYYETRGYREDALAKGKAAHAELTTAFEGTLAGIDAMDTVLTAHARAESTKRIADLRKAGEDNAANLVEASAEAELLVSYALDNKFTEADAILPKLEAALAKLRESQAKMDAGDMNKMHYSMTADALTSVVGAYRDHKQSPSESNKEAVLRAYNEAVTASNRAELPG